MPWERHYPIGPYFKIRLNQLEKNPKNSWSIGLPGDQGIHSLRLTAKAPENRPGLKRKQSYSNHPFLQVLLLMEDILHHLRCIKPRTYQLVSRISSYQQYVGFRKGKVFFFSPGCLPHHLDHLDPLHRHLLSLGISSRCSVAPKTRLGRGRRAARPGEIRRYPGVISGVNNGL